MKIRVSEYLIQPQDDERRWYGKRSICQVFNGTSLQFECELKGRYLLLLTEGSWHGNDYFKQVDVFVK